MSALRAVAMEIETPERIAMMETQTQETAARTSAQSRPDSSVLRLVMGQTAACPAVVMADELNQSSATMEIPRVAMGVATHANWKRDLFAREAQQKARTIAVMTRSVETVQRMLVRSVMMETQRVVMGAA
jgi:hypothetical protein